VAAGVEKIIAVEAKKMYNLGEGLTEEMTKVIPGIVEKVKKVLKTCLVGV